MNIEQKPYRVIKSSDESQGVLSVFEFNEFVFNPRRVFTVASVQKNSTRGRHAHKKCRQLIACISGEIEILCIFGSELEKKIFQLSPKTKALLIEPGVWAEQTYKTANSVAIVFCSDDYDELDYIRNYQDFKKYIKAK